MRKTYLYITLVILVLLIGCTAPEEQSGGQRSLPESGEETTAPPKQETVPITEEPTEELIKIPNDIKEILEKGKTKLNSYSYNYKGPDSDLEYEIYVKGNKMKIVPPEITNVGEGKFYNTIYLDTEKETAEAYCMSYSNCGINIGKIKDIDYEGAYIETPLEWIEKITEAQPIDERQVEGRKAVYIQTNIGKLTVESFYGFLYKIENNKKKWEFTDAALNSLSDDDVTP